MPRVSALKKQTITLAQLSAYDDILTDALVDHAYYWTTIPKNHTAYRPSRGIREEDVTDIVQKHLIVEPDPVIAQAKLLALDGVRKFHKALKTTQEQDDFRQHLSRYAQIYLPDCPFEVNTTNRYTIVTHEASVTARRFIRRGESVKYLSGIRVLITAKEEEEISKRKKDFSIVVSSRNKCASLFMGPARFANHDCGANAQLNIVGQSNIEIHAVRDIEVGDEITVTYGDNYFGEGNCECLCQTCENSRVNGWAQSENEAREAVKTEDEPGDGYQLRHRRREQSSTRFSRTPSAGPEVRPKVRRTRSKTSLITESERADPNSMSRAGSPPPEVILREKRKRDIDSMNRTPKTPPDSPGTKRLKPERQNVEPVPTPEVLRSLEKSCEGDSTLSELTSSVTSDFDGDDTDITTPDEQPRKSPPPIPNLHEIPPLASDIPTLKREETEPTPLNQLPPAPPGLEIKNENEDTTATESPLPSIETAPATGAVAVLDTIHAQDPNGQETDVEVEKTIIVIPPPLTQASVPNSIGTTQHAQQHAPMKRGRGRPRKVRREPLSPPKQHSPSKVEAVAPARFRTPGDYTLTSLLLSSPAMAWIHCLTCNTAFVQEDAYFTRSSCPRCERHSKLYGFVWPKTEKEGRDDTEERVLDHRTVHRFLEPEEEARIRGHRFYAGKRIDLESTDSGGTTDDSNYAGGDSKVPFPAEKASTRASIEDEAEGSVDPTLRRSGRRRQPGAKRLGSG